MKNVWFVILEMIIAVLGAAILGAGFAYIAHPEEKEYILRMILIISIVVVVLFFAYEILAYTF